MTDSAPVVLHVSPHPDDELLGAPATLMALRDGGWRVVNLACSLGRAADSERRLGELEEACRRACFELVISDQLVAIGREDDLELARASLAREVAAMIESSGPALIIGPSPDDAHHGHRVVGSAVLEAVQSRGQPARIMFWGLWRDLADPNVLVPFGADRLAEIQHALAAHTGELARNRYDRLLEARATANAVLGPERVFGYGSRGTAFEYAELLTDVQWLPSVGSRPAPPRIFDATRPLGSAREEIAGQTRQLGHDQA